MFNISHIHHVAIICSDYKTSKFFYSELLGFDIIRETYREERQSFKLDLKINENEQIELFSFPHPPIRPSHPEAQGLRHLAFAVSDLDACVKHLKENKIEVEDIRTDHLTGQRFTFFADPDNLPLELYEIT